tara:strand:- start:252 stop:734 length:483 start_codon:yes stop_codon:yes gene_type:complete
MTLIIETGTGKTDSQTYISEIEMTAYAAARGITIVGDVSVLLLRAALYVEGLSFIGLKNTKEQAMQFPRLNAYIDDFAILTTEIPQLLKDLQAEVSIAIGNANDPLATVERAVKKEKVDKIEVEYQDNAAPFVYNLRIKSLERKLVTSGSGTSSFSVSRG